MRFLYAIYSFLAVFVVVFSEKDIEVDDGVLVLTKDNFKTALADIEHLLVEFYAPWCGHCKALAPEYAKAAKELASQESPIKLAKIDATVETELAEKYGIRGYPTMKLFSKGNPLDYNGPRKAEDMINWLKKKTGPPAKELKTVEEAKEFVDSNTVVVIGFFKDLEKAASFLQVASAMDDVPFGITSEDAVLAEYEASCGNIILFKKFEDGKSVFEGEPTSDNLRKFVMAESMPLIVEFNHETAQKIFGGDFKNHLLLFLSKEAGHFDKYVEGARSVAKPFRQKVLFVTIDVDEEDHKRILEFFGLQKEEVPTLRIINLDEDMAKYKPDTTDLDAESIRTFVQNFMDGKLKQHLLSQTLPADWDKHPVKVLVASNFDEVVFDKEKDVLVEFYAPWCGHCKQLAPIYDQLGEKFASSDSVVIAKMDATINELEHTKIVNFPTLKLYKKGTNEAVEYNGERTLEGLTKFLESGGTYGEAAPDKPEDEDEDEDENDDTPPKDEL